MTDAVLRHPDIPQPLVVPLSPDGGISPEYEASRWEIDHDTTPPDAIAEAEAHTESLRIESLDDPPVPPHFDEVPETVADQPPADQPSADQPADPPADPPADQPPAGRTLYRHVGDETFDVEAWPAANLVNAAGDQLYAFAGDTEPGDAKGASDEWVVDVAADPQPTADTGEQPDPSDTDTSGEANSSDSTATPASRRRGAKQ